MERVTRKHVGKRVRIRTVPPWEPEELVVLIDTLYSSAFECGSTMYAVPAWRVVEVLD